MRAFSGHLMAGRIFLVVVALILAEGCSQVRPSAPVGGGSDLAITPAPRATAVVQKGPISAQVRIIGRVDALRQADLSFGTAGQIAKLLVKAGDEVQEGQPLAELEIGNLPTEVQQAQLNLDLAKVKLDQARAQKGDAASTQAMELKTAELAVRQSEAQVAKAQDDLAKAKAQPDPTTAAEAAVTQAQLNLELAKQNHVISDKSEKVSQNVRDRQNEHNWYEVNYGEELDKFKKGSATQKDVDIAWSNLLGAKERLDSARAEAQIAQLQADQSVAQAQTALDKAKADLEAVKARPKDAEVKSASLALEAAQLGLEKAQADFAQKQKTPASDDLELKLLQNAVDQAKVALDGQNAKLAAAKLAAPFQGRILYVRGRVGDQVQANQALIGLADPRELQVRTELADIDLQQVAIGQKATFSVDTLPGQTLKGTVLSVPTRSAGANDDRSVVIDVDWPEGAIGKVQLGMLARGDILVQAKSDALIIPARAIKSVGSRTFVEYLDGNIRRAQNVEVGIVSDESAEILQGLHEGQVILVGP